jgi:nucleoid-associated protein YgaU
MPNDARLGLVVGVTVVILVAVLFVRRDSMTRGAPGKGSPHAAVVQLPSMAPGVPGVPRPALFSARTHTVGEGDTLTSVAVRYYNDPAQVSLLMKANRDRIMGPDRVPVGTVLVIPER